MYSKEITSLPFNKKFTFQRPSYGENNYCINSHDIESVPQTTCSTDSSTPDYRPPCVSCVSVMFHIIVSTPLLEIRA